MDSLMSGYVMWVYYLMLPQTVNELIKMFWLLGVDFEDVVL